MFRVYLVPLTPFFPEGLKFAHRGFTVRGGFQERNLRKRRGCAVCIMQRLKPVPWCHSDHLESRGRRHLLKQFVMIPVNY
jgi:hypothetical protein